MDWTATILAAAGVQPDRQLGGINLLPLLQGKQPLQERTLHWRIDRTGFRQQAIRSGKWKLVTQPTSVSKSEQAGLGQMIHYQLSTLHSQLFCTAATASKR
jgi:arylsulfatase A-like enzyme